MNKQLLASAEYAAQYKTLKEMRTLYKAELRRAPDGHLIRYMNRKKINYAQEIIIDGKRNRTGLTKNRATIRALARKKYLEEALKIIEIDLKCIARVCSTYVEPSHSIILDNLPPTYGELSTTDFLPNLAKANAWAAEKYKQNTKNPQSKVHIADNGMRVRSKSELLIINKLIAYGIPFRYDELICIAGHWFSPDFSIMKGDKIIYWEHCGLTDNVEYLTRHYNKMIEYAKSGILPWKNLIVTYDEDGGGINSRLIDEIIRTQLL